MTPPMGWNSWNRFACDSINEKVIRETADAMVAAGMQQAGYRYTRSILTNREAIAIDQDPLGHQCYRALIKDELDIHIKPLKDGDTAICLLNRGSTAIQDIFPSVINPFAGFSRGSPAPQ